MKIVSFTMVNNESEIIESFIRYNYNFVDEMIIIDNGCTDSTMRIVRNMIAEGFKITVFDESLETYNQYRLDNKYLTKIINVIKPDLILPLDADEFLTGNDNPRNILESLPLDRIYYVNWRWYVMTRNDDSSETFIPKRMKYCLTRPAWNYSDGTPVTKVIIPAKYYKKMGLTLSMGHHTVFGNDKVKITNLHNLQFAHYRAISEEQLIYKTCCYTMRDIATMSNNIETAQRTNQLAIIEQGSSMWEVAEESSYGGYPREIKKMPLELSFCNKCSLEMKFSKLSSESIATRVMKTGQEMAIRAYNLERRKKEYHGLEPIVLWMDGIKKTDVFLPDPSNESTLLVAKYNVRAYLTLQNEIKFLKCNYRLIVTPEQVKFIPYKYIVIPNSCDVSDVRNQLLDKGFSNENVISIDEYKKTLGFVKRFYTNLLVIPGMMERVGKYIERNGINGTIKKINERLKRR